MTIYQFESGHGVGPGQNGLGQLVPLFTIRDNVDLVVFAGDDAPQAKEPMVSIDSSTAVSVTWRLYSPGEDGDGLVVGVRSVVLAASSEPLLQSQLFADLEKYESAEHENVDWQQWARKAHGQLVALHQKYVALKSSAIPEVADPTEPMPRDVDPNEPIVTRVQTMRKVLLGTGLIGSFDKLDASDEPIVAEGMIDLRNVLAEQGIELDAVVQRELLALPIIGVDGITGGLEVDDAITRERYGASWNDDEVDGTEHDEAPGTAHFADGTTSVAKNAA